MFPIKFGWALMHSPDHDNMLNTKQRRILLNKPIGKYVPLGHVHLSPKGLYLNKLVSPCPRDDPC